MALERSGYLDHRDERLPPLLPQGRERIMASIKLYRLVTLLDE